MSLHTARTLGGRSSRQVCWGAEAGGKRRRDGVGENSNDANLAIRQAAVGTTESTTADGCRGSWKTSYSAATRRVAVASGSPVPGLRA